MAKKNENGKYYNEKQAEYAKKYLKNFEKIEIRVPQGDKKMYHEQMTKLGYTTWTRFIIDAMDYFISKNKKD